MNKLRNLWKDRDNQLQYVKWLTIYTKPYMLKIMAIMFWSIGASLVSIGMSLVMKQIIDKAQHGDNKIVNMIIFYLALVILMLFTLIFVRG